MPQVDELTGGAQHLQIAFRFQGLEIIGVGPGRGQVFRALFLGFGHAGKGRQPVADGDVAAIATEQRDGAVVDHHRNPILGQEVRVWPQRLAAASLPLAVLIDQYIVENAGPVDGPAVAEPYLFAVICGLDLQLAGQFVRDHDVSLRVVLDDAGSMRDPAEDQQATENRHRGGKVCRS